MKKKWRSQKKKSKIRSTKTKNLLRSKKNLLQIGRGLPDGLPLADPPLETIRIITEQENQKCDLPVNQNFNIFVPEKYINIVFVHKNPVPGYIQRSKPLDDYFIEIQPEKTKHSTKTFENVFEELQQCNLMTFGSLLHL